MGLKKLSVGFDDTINTGGVGAAMFFVLIELTYINSKSLYYLDNADNDWAWLFAITGSMAYSIVTIVVMRKRGHKWLKRIFPLFDVALVFCGYNIHLPEQIIEGTFNPVRLALTIFFAIFTGFITYSLGMINYEDKETELQLTPTDEQTKIVSLSTEVISLKSDLVQSVGELMSAQSKLEDCQTQISQQQTYLSERQSKIASLETEIQKNKSDIARYRTSYLASERSRILKKRQDNRTPEELKIIEECEMSNY